jgi:hypothetical protein
MMQALVLINLKLGKLLKLLKNGTLGKEWLKLFKEMEKIDRMNALKFNKK